MGGTSVHAGILAQWFEMLLQLLFLRYATMVISGIVLCVMTPSYLYFAGIFERNYVRKIDMKIRLQVSESIDCKSSLYD